MTGKTNTAQAQRHKNKNEKNLVLVFENFSACVYTWLMLTFRPFLQ